MTARVPESFVEKVGQQWARDRQRPSHWLLFPVKVVRIYLDTASQKEQKKGLRYRMLRELHNGLGSPRALFRSLVRLMRVVLRKAAHSLYARCGPSVRKVDYRRQRKLLNAVPSARTPSASGCRGRICYVLHNTFPYASGGYAVRGHGLASALIELGHEVVCISRPGFPYDTDKSRADAPSEVDVDGVLYVHGREPRRYSSSLSRYMRDSVSYFEKCFREYQPKVVVGASFYYSALPALIAARRVGIPFVYEIRGLADITKSSRDPSYLRTGEAKLFREMDTKLAQSADLTLTLTDGMKDELVHRGVARNHIQIVPNCCDVRQHVPRSRDAALARDLGLGDHFVVIGYIGTLVDYEGLDDLMDAASALSNMGYEYRILIVGSEAATSAGTGSVAQSILDQADRLGVRENIVLHGRVPHKEISRFYSLIDIAVFPRKPWQVCEIVSPMKPIEAMAETKPVVCSNVSALGEIVRDGDTGLLFQKGDSNDLARQLAILIDDCDMRQRIGSNARKFVESERTWLAGAHDFANHVSPLMALTSDAEDRGDWQCQSPVTKQIRAAQRREPAWWRQISEGFKRNTMHIHVPDWPLSDQVKLLRERYVNRFGDERVSRRIPEKNWQRADICTALVPEGMTVMDVGTGLGEFVNLCALKFDSVAIRALDIKRYDLWHDFSGKITRETLDIFDVQTSECADVVTCFEVIEHLDPDRVEEAVKSLRAVARKRLLISVPFLEPEPLYKGHFTRFTEEKLRTLFPDATFIVCSKNLKRKDRVWAWIVACVDLDDVERPIFSQGKELVASSKAHEAV